MLQQIISYISTLDPALVYVVLFFFAFIENIFPPSPSDVVVVVGATLVANSTLGFIPILILTTIGSTIGFVVMYFIGEFFGGKILRAGKLKFITKEGLDKADSWFHKYGYKLILINRFMPGTRAVMSFFSGVHRLKQTPTFIYAAVSSFFWNAFLIFIGIMVGRNVDLIDKYLKTYENIFLVIMVLVVSVILIRFLWKRRKNK